MLMYDSGVTEAQFRLLALVAHHVRSLSLKTLDLTGTRALKTLLGARVCLHLRHTIMFDGSINPKRECKDKEITFASKFPSLTILPENAFAEMTKAPITKSSRRPPP